MMDKNVYVAPDGKRYRVEESPGCIGCHFFITEGGCEESRNHGRPPCIGRADHRSVIWVPDDAPASAAELTVAFSYPGTLRDWFAGMAMQGLVSSVFNYISDENAAEASTASARRIMNDIGIVSYQIGDAMMVAREARE